MCSLYTCNFSHRPPHPPHAKSNVTPLYHHCTTTRPPLCLPFHPCSPSFTALVKLLERSHPVSAPLEKLGFQVSSDLLFTMDSRASFRIGKATFSRDQCFAGRRLHFRDLVWKRPLLRCLFQRNCRHDSSRHT